MAIWQFHIYFIPRQSLVEKYAHIPITLEVNQEAWTSHIRNGDLNDKPSFEDALTILWWSNVNLNLDELLPTLQEFGELQKWTADVKGLRSFGNPETNDVSACFDEETNKVEELCGRIDLRQIDSDFIKKLFSLAISFDCLLMDKQGRLFEPTSKSLIDAIQLSNARRFVENPTQFLNDLSKGIVKPE